MRVGVDLCNTIADVNAEIKKVLGLREDHVFREYGLEGTGIKDKEADGWFKKHPEVFAEAVPLPGSVKALGLLAVRGADIYYVTSRPAWAREITERWLRKWGFPEGKLVVEADKARVYKSRGLGLFFEDVPEEIERLQRVGANVVAVAQPYNTGVFRWELVLEKGGNFLDIFLYGAGMLPGLPQAVLLPLR